MGESLPAGHEVIAEAFGDFVYLHADLVVNCPMCSTPAQFTKFSRVYLFCIHCGFWEPCNVIDASQRWVVFPTSLFIAMRGRNRFYFPTAWNSTNPWMDRKQLEEQYEAYLKEKRECLDRMQVA